MYAARCRFDRTLAQAAVAAYRAAVSAALRYVLRPAWSGLTAACRALYRGCTRAWRLGGAGAVRAGKGMYYMYRSTATMLAPLARMAVHSWRLSFAALRAAVLRGARWARQVWPILARAVRRSLALLASGARSAWLQMVHVAQAAWRSGVVLGRACYGAGSRGASAAGRALHRGWRLLLVHALKPLSRLLRAGALGKEP